MKSRLFSRVRFAAIVALLALATPSISFAAEPLSQDLAADVNQSYDLIDHTFYRNVDAQSLLEAARSAIIDEANKHHARLTLDQFPSNNGEDAAITWIDGAIANAAETSHVAPTTFAYAAIAGMAHAVGDKYTVFMTPDDYKAFNNALDPERISGIGVLIQPDQTTSLMSVFYVVPGTPADRAGLQSGDILSTIDGTSTKAMSIENASKLLRGKAGMSVHLEIARGTDRLRPLDITRSEIQPPTVIAKMMPEHIGYIYVTVFGKDTPDQFDAAIARLREAGAKALLVDLRSNGGGYVESALRMSSRFVAHREPLLTVQQRGAPDETVHSRSTDLVDIPVTLLVNQGTASASEIMAGAMQDDGVAQLIGARTFGKGVMQTLTPLQDGAAIKITTAHYLTPAHRDINLRGIEPDVAVDEPRDSRFGDAKRDPQLRAALSFLQKKIAASEPASSKQ